MPNKIDVLNVGEIDYKLDASYVNGKPADEIATIKSIFSATGSNLAIWSGTTVPNSGSTRKIYINHNLTDDDVISCLAKISLDKYQIHDGNLHRYIVAKSDEMALEVELDHENKWYGIYKTFSEFDEIMFSGHITPKAPFSGWKDFHDIFELGGDLDTYIEDKEIGTENDLLSSLFSAAPFKESKHSFYLSETDGKLYQKSEGKLVEVGKSSIVDVDALPDSESLYAPVPMGEYIESIFLNKSIDKNKVDNALKSLNIGDDEITLIFTEKNLGDLVFDYTKTLRLVFYKEAIPYVNDETVDAFRIAIKVAYTGTDVRNSVIYTSETGWDPTIDERIFIEGINLVDDSETNSEVAEIVKDFIFVSSGKRTSDIDESVIYRVRDEIGTYSLHQLINGTWRKICYSTDEIDNLIDVLTFGDLEQSYPALPSSNSASRTYVDDKTRETEENANQYTDTKTSDLKEYVDEEIAKFVGEFANGEFDENLEQLVEAIREIRNLKESGNTTSESILEHASDNENPHNINEKISTSLSNFTTEVITPITNDVNNGFQQIQSNIDAINTDLNENFSRKIDIAALVTEIESKVSAEDGKGLSTNDFTNEYREVIDNLGTTIDEKIESSNNKLIKHIVDIESIETTDGLDSTLIYRYNGNLYQLYEGMLKPINTEYISSVEQLGELMLEQQESFENQIASTAKTNAENTFTKLNTAEDNIALKTIYGEDGTTVDSSKTRIYPTVNDTGMVGAPDTHFKQGFINQIGSNQLLPLNKTGESFADNTGEIGNSSNRWKTAFVNNIESNKIKIVNANNIYTLYSGDSIKIEIPNQDDIDNPINYVTIDKNGITINGKKAITEITEDMLGAGLKLVDGKICLDTSD